GRGQPVLCAASLGYVHAEYSGGGHRWNPSRADTDQLNGTDGPAPVPDGRSRRLSRFDRDGKRSTFLENIQSGGLGFDPKGQLIANDNTPGKQGIYIVYPKGAEKTLVDQKTRGFMQSNDIVVDKKGGVYFTQPEQA